MCNVCTNGNDEGIIVAGGGSKLASLGRSRVFAGEE